MILNDQKDEEICDDENEYDRNRESDDESESKQEDKRWGIPHERIAC